jgi:hypothetical protein
MEKNPMSHRITIAAGSVSLEAELNESPTAQLIWDALPITSQVNTWGDEIYFEIPVTAVLSPDAREHVEVGELGYWPVGRAFCVFFGPTPASTGSKPRAASPVNIIGKAIDDSTVLREISSGQTVEISKGA